MNKELFPYNIGPVYKLLERAEGLAGINKKNSHWNRQLSTSSDPQAGFWELIISIYYFVRLDLRTVKSQSTWGLDSHYFPA